MVLNIFLHIPSYFFIFPHISFIFLIFLHIFLHISNGSLWLLRIPLPPPTEGRDWSKFSKEACDWSELKTVTPWANPPEDSDWLRLNGPKHISSYSLTFPYIPSYFLHISFIFLHIYFIFLHNFFMFLHISSYFLHNSYIFLHISNKGLWLVGISHESLWLVRISCGSLWLVKIPPRRTVIGQNFL